MKPLLVLLALAFSALAPAQDGVEIGLYIDGQPYLITSENCMLMRYVIPWGAPPPGSYALQFGSGEHTSGRVFVQPGGVTVVLPVIFCVDRLFTNSFEG